MVVFWLPRVSAQLSTDRGAVNTESARDVRVAFALFMAELDVDSVVKGQVAVGCGQGSADLRS